MVRRLNAAAWMAVIGTLIVACGAAVPASTPDPSVIAAAVASALASERAAAKREIPSSAPTTNAAVIPASCETSARQAPSGNVCSIQALLEAGAPAMRISLDRVGSIGADFTETLSVYQRGAAGIEERLWSRTASGAPMLGGNNFAQIGTFAIAPGQMSLVYVVAYCGANCGFSEVTALAVVGGVIREVLQETFTGVVAVSSSEGTNLRVTGRYWGPSDARCCPSGTIAVTYAWNGRGYAPAR